MSRLPDLVRDSKLETRFVPDFNVETVHTYHESERSRRRLVPVLEHWKRQEKIGGGGYSTVWLESCPKFSRHGVQVRAVKQIETGGRFARIDFNRELEAIAKFSHPKYERCFVKSFGWYSTPENLFISMEYLQLGDLHDYLLDRPPLSESQAQDISYQILEGLQMMHENEFMHRDLKPKNILIKSHPPQEWWIKIADFGISKRMEEAPETSTTLRGTAGFIAPELYGFINAGSLYAPDIWSFGEIIFQMLTKKPAFKPIGQLVFYMRQPEMFPSAALSDVGVTDLGIEFVRSLMNPKPDSRLTTKVALEHAWMQPPSEILSTSEAQPLPTVDDYQNPAETDKQRTESPTEIDPRGSETLRPESKPKRMIPKVATVEDYDSTDEDKPSSPLASVILEEYWSPGENAKQQNESQAEIDSRGSETLYPKRKTNDMSPKVATVEDYDSTDEDNPSSPLASALLEEYGSFMEYDAQTNELLTEIQDLVRRKRSMRRGLSPSMAPLEDCYATDEESESSVRSSAAVYNSQAPYGSQRQRRRGGFHKRVDLEGPVHPRSRAKGVSPNMTPVEDCDAADEGSQPLEHAAEDWYNHQASRRKQIPIGSLRDLTDLRGPDDTDEESESSMHSSAAVRNYQAPSRKKKQRGGNHERLDPRGPDFLHPRNMTKGVAPNMAPVDEYYATDEESLFSGLSGYAVRVNGEEVQGSQLHEDIERMLSETELRPMKPISSRTERQHTESRKRIADWLSEPPSHSEDFCHKSYDSTGVEKKFAPISSATASASDSTGGHSEDENFLNIPRAKQPTSVHPKPMQSLTLPDNKLSPMDYYEPPEVRLDSSKGPRLFYGRFPTRLFPSREYYSEASKMMPTPRYSTTQDPYSAGNATWVDIPYDRPFLHHWEYSNEDGEYVLHIRDVQSPQRPTNLESTSSHSRDRTTASKDPQKKETEERDEDTSSPRPWAKDIIYVSDGGTFIPRDRVRDSRQPGEYEMPWRKKGKTRIPRKLLHPRAIRNQGYPFKAEKNTIIIHKILSEEQIDELIIHSNVCKGLQGYR